MTASWHSLNSAHIIPNSRIVGFHTLLLAVSSLTFYSHIIQLDFFKNKILVGDHRGSFVSEGEKSWKPKQS